MAKLMGANEREHLDVEVEKLLVERSGQMAGASLFVKIALLGLGALAVGVAQGVTLSAGTGPPIWNVITIAGAVIVFLGSVWGFITEQDASKALGVAARAARQAREYREVVEDIADDLGDVQVSLSRATELYAAMNVMRGAIERLVNGHPVTEQELLQALLDVAARPLKLAAGIQTRHHYTICIYKAVPGSSVGETVLKCVAHLREVRCDLDKARLWPVGIGAVGVAYARGSEVLVADLSAPEVASYYDLPNWKPEDRGRYKSIVAVPILLGDDNLKWGVVTATSDEVGHFSFSAQNGVRTSEAARALAGMVALALTKHHSPVSPLASA
ncbi:MAG TPA: hypothetical protein VF138_08300 [Caulobacteraceae bacterium]